MSPAWILYMQPRMIKEIREIKEINNKKQLVTVVQRKNLIPSRCARPYEFSIIPLSPPSQYVLVSFVKYV